MKKRYWIAGAAGVAVAAKLLLRPSDTDWQKSRNAVFHAGYSRFCDVDSLRVHYQEAGNSDSPTILLIHGFCSSTLVWSKVFLEFAEQGFHVVAPDLLGYGYSAKPRNFDYTISAQARMIAGFLEQMGKDRVILVGSSYGGAVAATIALDYPGLVEKLVLVGTVSDNAPTRYLMMRLFASPILGDLLSPLLVGSRRLLRRRMKRVYDQHSWRLDERRLDARHLPLRTKGTHRALIRTVRHWDADRIQREARGISQPTLLLWGQDDQDVPLSSGEQLQGAIAGSQLVVFPRCGHLPQEEYPREFVEVVSSFSSAPGLSGEDRVTITA